MNVQIDRKSMIVGIAALIVGAGMGAALSHHGFEEREGDWGGRDRGGYENTSASREGMHDTSKMQDGESMQGTMNTMMSSLDGKTGDALEVAFLNEMTIHHQGAIDMAHTLLKGTKRPELVKLANDIIAAQTKEIEQMKAWRASWFAGTSTPAQ